MCGTHVRDVVDEVWHVKAGVENPLFMCKVMV